MNIGTSETHVNKSIFKPNHAAGMRSNGFKIIMNMFWQGTCRLWTIRAIKSRKLWNKGNCSEKVGKLLNSSGDSCWGTPAWHRRQITSTPWDISWGLVIPCHSYADLVGKGEGERKGEGRRGRAERNRDRR